MKTLEFIYQETQIHFALQNEGEVMINATEMAKLFDKRTKDYLANQSTKDFIEALERTPISVRSDQKIIENRGHMGVWFCELLAIDFATWLDIDFKVWVYKRIQEILFGHYKEHWDAHIVQMNAEKEMDLLEERLLVEPTPEMVRAYFELRSKVKNAKAIKQKAIRNQLKLEF